MARKRKNVQEIPVSERPTIPAPLVPFGPEVIQHAQDVQLIKENILHREPFKSEERLVLGIALLMREAREEELRRVRAWLLKFGGCEAEVIADALERKEHRK